MIRLAASAFMAPAPDIDKAQAALLVFSVSDVLVIFNWLPSA